MRKLINVLCGVTVCLGGSDIALATPEEQQTACTWVVVQQVNVDGGPVNAADTSSGWPAWAWWANLDTSPWNISADAGGWSGEWGFDAVARSANPSNGKWMVQRVTQCAHPLEDIEVQAQAQFHAEARLDADELCRVAGVLRLWCMKTQSTHHPNAVAFGCTGGVQCVANDDNDSEAEVEYAFAGLTLKLKLGVGNGQAKTDDPHEYDDGAGGKSPEYFNTYTHCECGMDLDSFDNCNALISQVKWLVFIDGTCDGTCNHVQRVFTKNDFQQ